MLVSKIWGIFEAYGNIEAYLYYKEYEKINKKEVQNERLEKDDGLSDNRLLQGF